MYFEDFQIAFPDRVSPVLRVIELYTPQHPIDEEVQVEKPTYIGSVKRIGSNCLIGDGVIIDDGVEIGERITIGDKTVLENGVTLTDELDVGAQVFFCAGSSIDSMQRERTHHYLRSIHDRTIIGPRVVLPSEVQIGPYAVVPTTKSIAQIGPFGESKRMVTVNGSDDGPQYNVGCQKGISYETFKERICSSEETTETSAADYKKNLKRIARLAEKVQRAYSKEPALVSELREQALTYSFNPQS